MSCALPHVYPVVMGVNLGDVGVVGKYRGKGSGVRGDRSVELGACGCTNC